VARRGLAIGALALAALIGAPLAAAAKDMRPPAHQAQVEARVIEAPQPVEGSDGIGHLAYELQVTSFFSGEAPLKLTRVAVFADEGTAPLAVFEGAQVEALLSQPSKADGPSDGVPIASGRSRTLYFWLSPPSGAAPKSLRHELEFATPDGGLERASDVRAPVTAIPPIRIGPPLRGGRWMAVEGPGDHRSHHWGGLTAIDGALTIPQRFAIDWFGLDEANHSLPKQHDSLAATVDGDWAGFGREVLAVADGVVVDARDGAPDGKPLAPQPEPDDLTARTLYGDFVVLQIGPNLFAHYAHLRAGSVAVRPGERIRRGAVIGRVGQTGAAGAPHLHFHVSDKPTFERSEGAPFVIDAFLLHGRGTIEQTFDPSKPAPPGAAPGRPRANEMPLNGDVVTFR